jgi:hypothetical protein
MNYAHFIQFKRNCYSFPRKKKKKKKKEEERELHYVPWMHMKTTVVEWKSLTWNDNNVAQKWVQLASYVHMAGNPWVGGLAMSCSLHTPAHNVKAHTLNYILFPLFLYSPSFMVKKENVKFTTPIQ